MRYESFSEKKLTITLSYFLAKQNAFLLSAAQYRITLMLLIIIEM